MTSPIDIPAPLRLRLDGAALADNWRVMDRLSGTAACGAAVKADGYGLGATEVSRRLAAAGCRDFFVATWAEAQALAPLGLSVSVLHGVRVEDMPAAAAGFARPVLNTPAQVKRWRESDGGPCDVMVDTGMNRLGVSVEDVRSGLLDGLKIDTLMSHLACADEQSSMNEAQRTAFASLAGVTSAKRMSLANSAGVGLGAQFAFDLTRPGLALYGGVTHGELSGKVRQVAFPQAQILQCRTVRKGGGVGYNATWIAPRDANVGIVNLGYADGYLRAFSNRGLAVSGSRQLPVIGRISMDLAAVDCTEAKVTEGDWLDIAFSLPNASDASGLSQYELLTQLGTRYYRRWMDL